MKSVVAVGASVKMGRFSSWMFMFLELSTVFSGGEAAHAVKRFTGLYTGPYFDPSAPTNITTQLGTHAYMPCKVKQLGNKSVSWIRKRDGHILTVDRYTFIADDRFQTFRVDGSDTWTLQIKYVQARDAGQYECQVSTEPKMSHFITLNIVIPKIEITGEPDMFVKMGSRVQLRCVITQALEEPAYIFWYHDGERVLTYDKSAIDIHAKREGTDTTVSTLLIHYTNQEDSGNYTCSPSKLDSSSVVLHVLNGEHPAAMQRGKNSASPIPAWSHLSIGLGLAACTPPRFAIAVALTLAIISEVLAC
ncbi:hemicentin-2 isoform X2 [Dendroctonus ponderosae]|uniref:Ig-like domain-containing protein n=1 Tax=Dendroctonus ponderosae TaxID=77166 RepID=A0AAR5PE68_DENPD|nr:hemicentin-2 isoform X2 [Dendroctonus ponderosae]XP_048525032.1 hemicentin-2 isoform X2 [Dendroctonus ponderosae]